MTSAAIHRVQHTTERARGSALRRLGALAVLGIAAVHVYEYAAEYYSQIPIIGPLFLLNGVSAAIVGLLLLAPVERLAARRLANVALVLLALGGIGIGIGALAALLISESTPLFGFVESGYRAIIVIVMAMEVAAVLLLGAFLTVRLGSRRDGRAAAEPEPRRGRSGDPREAPPASERG